MYSSPRVLRYALCASSICSRQSSHDHVPASARPRSWAGTQPLHTTTGHTRQPASTDAQKAPITKRTKWEAGGKRLVTRVETPDAGGRNAHVPKTGKRFAEGAKKYLRTGQDEIDFPPHGKLKILGRLKL